MDKCSEVFSLPAGRRAPGYRPSFSQLFGLSFLFFIFFLCFVLALPGSLNAQTAPDHYNRGREAMAVEDWYAAAEAFIEALRLNPAHAEASAALAECYYELGEFDEALVWTGKARSLARGSMALANLEAFTLIALGRLDAASVVIGEVLAREPYNREALFAAGELDVSQGRSSDALLRYREAVRRYPDDRRLLLSLALVSGSLGDMETAENCIGRALLQHTEDYRVYYYAAWLESLAGRLNEAVNCALQALHFRPGYAPARNLLASLRYRTGRYGEAVRLADEAIAANREDSGAWYLKGLSLIRLNRAADALNILSTAAQIREDDEFIRAGLEDLIISITSLEDPRRSQWASWHFNRARDFRTRHLIGEALFEYRRGLRLNPYARDRREYAELLRLQGYPARYLEELRFIQDLGMGDRTLGDAVEAYDSLLSGALYRQWQVNPLDAAKRHWKAAVFSLSSQSSFYHADAGATAAAYVKELLIHDRNIESMDLELRQSSFSRSFRAARDEGADYFLVLSVSENERDLSLRAELFVARTGASAGVFYAYRTGQDRLRNAARGIAEQFSASLPFRGELTGRRQSQGLINKGRVDGVKDGDVYDVVKKGRPLILNEGIGLSYTTDDLVGTITIDQAGEEVSAGTLSRNGFFDRIALGDEIILRAKKGETAPAAGQRINPELRALLRTLR
ncbi:MAG: tetratricopeptide repeat protein [Treponema sp.]|jgi:tetratricopeptide (TPR) repeat protein|nr:tetratricopeptide repeat protein [Treponema sp.]